MNPGSIKCFEKLDKISIEAWLRPSNSKHRRADVYFDFENIWKITSLKLPAPFLYSLHFDWTFHKQWLHPLRFNPNSVLKICLQSSSKKYIVVFLFCFFPFKTKTLICTNCAPYSASAPPNMFLLPSCSSPASLHQQNPVFSSILNPFCLVPPASMSSLLLLSCPVISVHGQHMALFRLLLKQRNIKNTIIMSKDDKG